MNWQSIDLTEIGTFIGSLLFICFVVYKTFKVQFNKTFGELNKPFKKVDIEKHNQITAEVEDKLDNIRELLNADSARIHLIHNGTHYLQGISSLKVNCVSEVLKYGIKSYNQMLIDVPIPISAAFIDKLLINHVLTCKDLEHCMSIDPNKHRLAAFKQLEDEIGNEALSVVLLRDANQEPIGFITFGYENKNNFIENKVELIKLAGFIEEKLQELSKLDNPDKK